ncbi:19553_t:CDS:1, partial [Racocetra persica]
LKNKKISLAHMQYINNRVLIPRVEYKAQQHILSREVCDKLQNPLFMLIKNKVRMTHTMPNAAIAHQNIVGIKTIWQNQIIHHVTELIARLNNRNDIGKTT